MRSDPRRIALVNCSPKTPQRSWDEFGEDRLTFYADLAAIRRDMELGHDIVRIVFDRSLTAEEFLDIRSSLPSGFLGDALFIRPSDCGYRSAIARGGAPILYALGPADVEFYLLTHRLLGAHVARRQRKRP